MQYPLESSSQYIDRNKETKPMRNEKPDTVLRIIEDRQGRYGDPVDHFCFVGFLKDQFRHYCNNQAETHKRIGNADRDRYMHAVDMILDKLVRSAHSPLYLDNWNDIQGYARCAIQALGITQEQGE